MLPVQLDTMLSVHAGRYAATEFTLMTPFTPRVTYITWTNVRHIENACCRTWVGLALSLLSPVPSCPCALLPHTNTSPKVVSASVCEYPMRTIKIVCPCHQIQNERNKIMLIK